jgi:UDP-3-O-[3-hydroxymyristoyl] glucosamine N-acyltransferase
MEIKAIQLLEIVQKVPAVAICGEQNVQVQTIAPFVADNRDPNSLSWLNLKNSNLAYDYKNGVLVVPHTIDQERLPSTATFLLYANPRKAFRDILFTFFTPKEIEAGISPAAHIGKNVKLGAKVSIGHNTVIEDNVVIGNNVRIGHGNSILRNTIIGNQVVIGNNNTVGGVGFGYEKNDEGHYELMPHLGNVIIEDTVEIGNNSCIDRAVLGSTIIRRNAKIDNLVHISHGVEIGENSLIIAHAIVCGSVKIGANVWVAPNSSIRNKVTIGDDSTIGLAAVVVKDVAAGETVIGNPARSVLKKA